MSTRFQVDLELPFAQAVAATRTALAEQGFGIITEIDMQATMRTKLGEEYPPFLILGACNPSFAHRALGVEPAVAALLPCNVVVRGEDGAVTVSSVDPQVLVQATGAPQLSDLADELSDMLAAALAALDG